MEMVHTRTIVGKSSHQTHMKIKDLDSLQKIGEEKYLH
jgi:hypothetical protein